MPRPIPVEFTTKGLTYRQVKRVKFVAIYAVHNRNGRLYGYEVVVLKVVPAAVFRGLRIPARESYPHSEQFGKRGWYFQHREDAEARFSQILGASKRPSQSTRRGVLAIKA